MNRVLSLAAAVTLGVAAIAGMIAPVGQAAANAPPNPDPVAIARAALEAAQGSLRCRYAFTLEERGENDTTWATFDLKQRQTLQFDPRRPMGDRWRILSTTRPDRIYQRRVFNYGGRSDPKTDLLTLTLEGDVVISDLALQSETSDAWVLSFRPSASDIVSRTGQPFLNAMTGELTVDKATGAIVRRRIFLKEPFDAGVGRVREGNFVREYGPGDAGAPLVRATNQLLVVTVRGRGIDTVGEQKIRNITPICDPAEVDRIAAAEAAAPNLERSDVKPPTGSRVWR